MARHSRKARKIVNQAEIGIEDQLLRAMITGEPINRDMAMAIPAVQKAVSRITNAFAILPFELYRETKDKNGKKKVEKIFNDRRNFLINDDTGDVLDGFMFKKALCKDYLLGKGGYAYIKRLKNDIQALHYVSCDSVSFSLSNDPIYKETKINCGGRMYKDIDFLKIIRDTENGAYGKSVISELDKALQTAFNSICYQLKLTKTSGAKRGFLQSTRKIAKEDIEKLKESWKKLYEDGTENVIILNDGVKFEPAQQTPYEMQLANIRDTLNKEIACIFGDDEDPVKFYKTAILPIVTAFETALNKYLLLETEKSSYYFAVDDRKLTQATLKERYEAYEKGIKSGFLMPSEARYEEDLDHVDGLDVFVMSLGNVLLDAKTGKYYVPNTGEVYKNGLKGGEE